MRIGVNYWIRNSALNPFSYTKSFLWEKPFCVSVDAVSLVSTSIAVDFLLKFVTTSTVQWSFSGFQCTRRFWRAFSPRRSISSWPVHSRLWPAREEWRATHSFPIGCLCQACSLLPIGNMVAHLADKWGQPVRTRLDRTCSPVELLHMGPGSPVMGYLYQ